MALEVDANVKIKALAFTAAALASFGRKSGKRNDASQLSPYLESDVSL